MLFIRRVLADKDQAAKVPPDLAKRSQVAIQELLDTMESGRRMHPMGLADVRCLARRVYEAAEQIAKAVGG
jgi:hypothetical protein